MLFVFSGTGTKIGDPTEVSALGTFFSDEDEQRSIGSVKTNIGHLEAAAGVAGLIKVLLMMQQGKIVKSLWYSKENENPKLNLQQYGFVVPTDCIPWERQGHTARMACVNSFGFGGTNAHVIVKQFYKETTSANKCTPFSSVFPPAIVISAHDDDDLKAVATHMLEALETQTYDLNVLSCTSTCRRDHLPKRMVFFTETQHVLAHQLRDVASGPLVSSTEKHNDRKRIVFVFCGVGTTWNGMAKWLLHHAVFMKNIEDIDRHLVSLTCWSIKDKLQSGCDSLANDPMVAHIAIFSYQVALAALWKHLGLKADAVIGQSVGEVAAAFVAGVFDLKTAVELIFIRSKSLATVNSGTMAVVKNVSVTEVKRYCKDKDTISIAVHISPLACTVAGERTQLKRLEKHFSETTGGKCSVIYLEVPCAYHSHFVEDAASDFGSNLCPLKTKRSTIPIYSSVTGYIGTSHTYSTSEYWQRNVRNPVLFHKAILKSRRDSSHTVYVEIGPNPVLIGHIKDIYSTEEDVTVIVSSRKNKERETMAEAICKLFTSGVDIQWSNITQCQNISTDIPLYQGKKTKHMYQSQSTLRILHGKGNSSRMNHLNFHITHGNDNSVSMRAVVSTDATPYVFEHVIQGQSILPGAFYSEIGHVVMSEYLPNEVTGSIVTLEFLRPLRLDPERELSLHVSTAYNEDEANFTVECDRKLLCKGKVNRAASNSVEQCHNMRQLEVTLSTHTEISKDEVYNFFSTIDFSYGGNFQLIQRVLTSGEESLSEIELTEEIIKSTDVISLHPCIIDSMLQTSFFSAGEDFANNLKHEKQTFLPVAIGALQCFRKPEKQMLVYTRLVSKSVSSTNSISQVHFNILLTDVHGRSIAEIQNFTASNRFGEQTVNDLSYELVWVPVTNFNKGLDHPSVFVLSCDSSEEAQQVIMNQDFLFHPKESSETISSYVKRVLSCLDKQAEKQNPDAIVVLFREIYVGLKNVRVSKVSHLHKHVRKNCQLLLDVLHEVEHLKLPVYVVTENTQQLQNVELGKRKASFFGSEVWGFIRSANVEFIADVTLVDVQPSLSVCRDSLVRFVSRTCKSVSKTPSEILIHEQNIFTSEFTRVSKSQQTAVRRVSYRPNQKLTRPHSLMIERLQKPSEQLHFTPTEYKSMHTDHVRIEVTSVTLLPSWLYPIERLATHIEQDPWPNRDGRGLPYYGVEFRGIVCDNTSTYKGRDKHKEVVVFNPAHVSSTTCVPKKNVVEQTVRRFEPGELLYSVINWQTAKHIPMRSSVVIYGSNDDIMCKSLQAVLETTKHAKVNFFDEVMDVSKADILITAENVDGKLKMLRRFNTIVLFQGHLSGDTLMALHCMENINITLIRHTDLFDKEMIQQELSDIVAWLNDHEIDTGDCTSVHILTDTSNSLLPIKTPLEYLFRKKSAYVITGGLSGLGWEMTKYMAELGAGTIATITRRPPTADVETKLDNLQIETGCKIVCLNADVCDYMSVKDAFLSIDDPVRGVFHCAGLTKGKIIKNMRQQDIDIVLQPKVQGTMNLHCVAAELSLKLEYFVIASSISSIIGSPGQTNYGAANAFIDGFATWRREHGLPCQAINWGALEVGMAANSEFATMFEKRGFNLMSVNKIRNCFKTCLLQDASRIVFADMNWDTVRAYFESQTMCRVRAHFDKVIKESATTLPEDLDLGGNEELNLHSLIDLVPQLQREQITLFVTYLSSKVLGMSDRSIDVTSSMAELSFDSMSTVTLVNVIQNKTGYRIPTEFLAVQTRTLSEVIDHLWQQIPTKDIKRHS